MQTREHLLTYGVISAEQVREAKELAVKLVEANLAEFTDRFPDSNSSGNFYPQTDNVEWTTGFWTGQIWLAYEETCREESHAAEEAKEALRHAGEVQVESFLDRIMRRVDVDHHDMGFLYSPSCVAAYMLTGNETAKRCV